MNVLRPQAGSRVSIRLKQENIKAMNVGEIKSYMDIYGKSKREGRVRYKLKEKEVIRRKTYTREKIKVKEQIILPENISETINGTTVSLLYSNNGIKLEQSNEDVYIFKAFSWADKLEAENKYNEIIRKLK